MHPAWRPMPSWGLRFPLYSESSALLLPAPQPQDTSLPLLQVACAAGCADTWQARVTDWPKTTVSSESSLRKDGAGEQEGRQGSLQR